ncbi:MAG: hypothetical protein F4206_13340 [Gammaproteobacteria bacterium]|nr:hypothetical protein [Gammaproteobacteria bacterium]MYG67694.1 hypothetical protein [Gammaproteobacteria bacterium]
MKINWEIEQSDIDKVKSLVSSQEDKQFVQCRKARNLSDKEHRVCKEEFWEQMVKARLTSVQRVGSGSPVAKFCDKDSFPLGYSMVSDEVCMKSFIEGKLIDHGGIRFYSRIAEDLTENFRRLRNSDWKALDRVNELSLPQCQRKERKVAGCIQESLKGFGPKQSRNLLQNLGLTRYEIPIDSRFNRWLNDEELIPIKLTGMALADKGCYEFVLDGIQKLCRDAEVYPCVLDAAVFSSFD